MQREQYYYSNTPYQHPGPDRGRAIQSRSLRFRPVEYLQDAEIISTPQGRGMSYCTIAESGQLYINSEITAKERLHDYQTAEVMYDQNYNVLAVKFLKSKDGQIPVVPRKNATMLYIKPVLNGINLPSQFMLGRRAFLFYDRSQYDKTFVILFGQPRS